jgi:hypothetical protein
MAYTTVADVGYELGSITINSSSTPTSTVVSSWIDESDAEINLMTNNVYSSTTNSSVLIDYDGSGILRLPKTPVISITSLETNVNAVGTAASWMSLQEGVDKNYILYTGPGEVHFISGDAATNKILPHAGKQVMRATYVSGYSSVPAIIKRLSTLLTAKRYITSVVNNTNTSQGGEVQVGPIRVSDPSNFSVSYVRQINDEIDRLRKQAVGGLKVFRVTHLYNTR